MTILYPLNDNIGSVSLVDKMENDIALKVVNAARVSYGKKNDIFTDKDKKLTKYLWENEHSSPFRHSYYTFLIKMPLFVSRQWLKYQVGSTWRTYTKNNDEISLEIWDLYFDSDKGCSWNELSGRYSKIKPEFHIPRSFRGNPSHGNKQSSQDLNWMQSQTDSWHLIYKEHYINSYKLYEAALEEGISKEQARALLPQSMYTTAYWTVSLQGVLWFLHQRTKLDAQEEIRKYANAIKDLIYGDLIKLGIEV